MRRRTVVMLLATIVVAGILVVGASAISGLRSQDRDPDYAAWAPGVAAPVGAMNRLDPVTNPPAQVLAVIQRVTQVAGNDPIKAAATLRQLRTGLGTKDSSIYAFQPDANATCLVVVRGGFACPTNPKSPHPGLVWMAGGGYPAWATANSVAVPPDLVGIAADNIESLTLVENGHERNLEIKNNAFYTELDFDQKASSRSSIELRVDYVSGATTTIPVGP